MYVSKLLNFQDQTFENVEFLVSIGERLVEERIMAK